MENTLPRGLIVSCQALKNEPLYGGDTIPKMALAAEMGGAVGIRANTVKDINAIDKKLNGRLPIIGLIKKDYSDSPIYITPTFTEVKALIKTRCLAIALDATARVRHNGIKLADLIAYIREHSDKKIVADIATYEEAMEAERLGVDYISTTMCGYTEETKGVKIPNFELCRRLKQDVKNAVVIAEGGIQTYNDLDTILSIGIDHIIIGGAITRPKSITSNYVRVFQENKTYNMSLK
jgi:N-acylglucosamine-6-phosphate 2-epimerase